MNCVLFAKMDQVFSLKNETFEKYWKNGKKNTGKVMAFCQSGKVGTMNVYQLHSKQLIISLQVFLVENTQSLVKVKEPASLSYRLGRLLLFRVLELSRFSLDNIPQDQHQPVYSILSNRHSYKRQHCKADQHRTKFLPFLCNSPFISNIWE